MRRLRPLFSLSLIPLRHALCHSEQKHSLAVIHSRERLGKPAWLWPLISLRAPCRLDALGKQKFRFLWRFLAFVEESVQRDFERPCVLLQRLDCRDGVPILDAGCVAANQASAVFDVTFAE